MFLGQLTQELRSWLISGNGIKTITLRIGRATFKYRVPPNPAFPALLAGIMANLPGDFSSGDGRQKPPEIIPISDVIQPPPFSASAKTLKGADRNIILIQHPPLTVPKPLSGQTGQPVKVSFPEFRSRRFIALLEFLNPPCHRLIACHWMFPESQVGPTELQIE
jgi:hypothetical protein